MAEQTDAGTRAEQRTAARLPLQKNALLIARGMKQRACQMRDVCSGGALLELLDGADEGRGFRRGEVILMRVLLGEGENARPHELRARIAHADGHLFGVSFFNPDPDAVANLLAAAGVAPVPVPALTAETQQLIEERLGQQLLNYCAHSLGPLFQASDEALLAAAEHAHSASEQRLFFEAATLLRKRRDDLRTRFIKELKRSLAQPSASDDVAGLAHADREQFEAWLVVKVMAARVEETCRLPLQDLQARLDALGHSGPDRQFRPFAPAALCVVFQQVIADLRFAPVIEKVLYRALEETLLANLCGIYELLNKTLVEHHVLPRLEAAPEVRAPAAARPATAVSTAVANTQPPRTAADFLARAGGEAVPAGPRPGPGLAALRELLALERGQGEAAAFDGIELRRVFALLKGAHDGWRPALAKFVEHAGASGVAGELLALLPFAEALLEALAPEEGAARSWLGQLELPLLHALVSDDTFFSSAVHPLRHVLEALARLGARETPLAAAQRSAIDALVLRLARDFDSEPGVVATILPELEPLVAAQAQAGSRNRERVCLAAEGEQRLTDARRHVQEVLDTRLAGRKVPQPVLTLLDAGWRDLLVNTLLRQGGRGGNWDAYLGLVDELLAIGADPRRSFDLRAVLQLLKQGLAEGGELNPRRQQQAIAELKPLLAGAPRLLEDTVTWVVLPARKDGVDRGERWLEKWLERAQRLQAGDWLELQHRGGAATERLALAWRDEAGERFVFVNRQGLKAGDFSRQELASLMHNGNALVCDTPPGLVDEALLQAGHRLYERLVRRVTHDPLTGLANRAEFMRQVERALEAARRQRTHHVLARISLDQFASIHASARAVADHLLRGVAQLLGKALAPRTLVARLGDGEFALLLEDCELAKAQQLFSMRLGELAALRLTYEGESYKLTASAGLVEVSYTSESAVSLLRAAGDASAEAQRHGGNRIEVYRPTRAEQERRDAVVVWVARLNDALEAERLALRCQRIQAATAAAEAPPLGYEILLGLPPEEGVSPPPGEFVQAAERYQRMLAVDRWVIEHTFRWLRENPERLAGLGMVSINLSAQSLADAQTPGFIFERLLRHKLPPAKFCFEISEAAAIAHLADAADFMQELKKAGCRFALDDFGAGHAAGEPLRRLPLDFVKIDGAFVRALGDDAEGDVLLRAINAFAHYAGVQTIAENVEDDATLARLRALGVDFAQGYGIERPRPLE
ncbi:MAG: hypothetical protein K0Q68_991 [Moraxellaceae bacterium]|jgi:diguanylate cyclase (GGDEF)-like protein|nr:hypothetical protein [Moraxellaceae bacterium]